MTTRTQASRQEVLHHRQALHQVELLEHHADVAARAPQFGAIQLHEILAVEDDLTEGRLDQPVDAADERALAGSRRTDDRRDAARGDLEIDVGQDRLVCDVRLRQVAKLQHQPFFAFAAAASAASRLVSLSYVALSNPPPEPLATLRTTSHVVW
jgi:hypothetical protein